MYGGVRVPRTEGEGPRYFVNIVGSKLTVKYVELTKPIVARGTHSHLTR